MLLTEERKLCTCSSLFGKGKARGTKVIDTLLSGKNFVLVNLLGSIRRHNPTDKMVIISNFTFVLDAASNAIMRKKGRSFVRLDGTTSNKDRGWRLRTQPNWRQSPHQIDADWNLARDHQAMAQVYHHGQTKPCFVYRLFTAVTVEKVIYQRQIQRRNLARLTNDGGGKRGQGSRQLDKLLKGKRRAFFVVKEGCTCDTNRKLQN
ncbi:hypothetical protein ACHAWF_007488 [Thalassiosira exigua]